MPTDRSRTLISLSLLEFESDLLEHLGQLSPSEPFSKILELVNSGELHSLHIDVMRPPLIPGRSAFPIELIRKMYKSLHEKIALEIHLMTGDPDRLIREISEFIEPKERNNATLIIQREAFSSAQETVERLALLKSLGYKAGIGLNLLSVFENLTEEIIRVADMVLIMSVPMGRGGQRYDDRATARIKSISDRFPDKIVEVDGGINDETASSVRKAGAKIFVIGSFVTMSRKPLDALERLERAVGNR